MAKLSLSEATFIIFDGEDVSPCLRAVYGDEPGACMTCSKTGILKWEQRSSPCSSPIEKQNDQFAFANIRPMLKIINGNWAGFLLSSIPEKPGRNPKPKALN